MPDRSQKSNGAIRATAPLKQFRTPNPPPVISQPRLRGVLITSATFLSLIAISGFAVGAFFTGVLGPGPMARCDGHRKFDPSLWQDSAAVYGPQKLRGCMVDDLPRRHALRGRTRAQVVALLGEPRPTSYFQEYDLVYWLGPERSALGLDSEWLVLQLDKAGRVTEHRLVTD